MGGFTFNGIHCEDLGCTYIPGPEARWFESPEFENRNVEFSYRDGGAHYGTRVKIRTFTLDCFFELISMKGREKIRRWLARGVKGDLIFDERPFVKYKARVAKVVTGKIYQQENSYAGTFTVTFEAEDPFGYMLYKSYTSQDTDGAGDYCNILPTSMMPASPTASSRQFYLYNPGTEPCGLILTIEGTSTGNVAITNNTNGTQCVLEQLAGTTLVINSETGNITSDGLSGFAFHDHGFIRLDPCLNIYDEFTMEQTYGSATAELIDLEPDENMIGKYIWTGSKWELITDVGADTITMHSAADATSVITSRIVELNDITIGGAGISLTTLSCDYHPRLL